LKGLSESCEFGTLRGSLIKDRILLRKKSKQVQVALLNQKDLILEKSLSICRSSELTEQHLTRINDVSTSSVNAMRTESADKNFQKKSRDCKNQNCKYCSLKHAKCNCPA